MFTYDDPKHSKKETFPTQEAMHAASMKRSLSNNDSLDKQYRLSAFLTNSLIRVRSARYAEIRRLYLQQNFRFKIGKCGFQGNNLIYIIKLHHQIYYRRKKADFQIGVV